MFLNRYVFALILSGFVSLVSFLLVLTRIDPFQDEILGVMLFFLSLFFSLISVLSLAGYIIRLVLYRDELFLNHFNISLRQGAILAFSICILLGLQLMRTLTWWNGLIVILIGFLVEIYFVAKE